MPRKPVDPPAKLVKTQCSPPKLSVIDLTTQNVPPEAPDASAKVSDSASANPLKRTIDDPEGPQSGSDSDSSDDDNLVITPDKSPDQVRKAIRAFIENGDMKIYEFCKAIGVSNSSYNNFLKQTGNSKGLSSETYPRAWRFFQKREQKGKPWPRKRAKKAAGGANVPTTDISEVDLPGEENNQVKIFDTCAEIRKKIGAHLRKPNVTQAQFCRDLKAQFHGEDTPKVSSTSLDQFRGKKGTTQGNMSSVYYAAYCFFEKTRVKEGKQKSKVREEMEKEWPEGVITDRPLDRIIAPEGAHVYQNKYGHMHCDNRVGHFGPF